ncbi:hypothetical protein, partial [Xanthomonas bonasiae]|uniref:hypothetical protein n=1 Tax=Xanthomonas bonasiae TaxID=2810351 RepID=UPI0019811277
MLGPLQVHRRLPPAVGVGLARRPDREVEQMRQCCTVQQLFDLRRWIRHGDRPCGVGRRCGLVRRWCGVLGAVGNARRGKLGRLATQFDRVVRLRLRLMLLLLLLLLLLRLGLLLLLLFLLLILIYRVPYVAANRAGKTPKGRRTGMCAVRGRGRMPLPRI